MNQPILLLYLDVKLEGKKKKKTNLTIVRHYARLSTQYIAPFLSHIDAVYTYVLTDLLAGRLTRLARTIAPMSNVITHPPIIKC